MDIVTLTLAKNYTNKIAEGKANLRNGKVPSTELPSYMSTVVEYASYQDLPAQGASDTIYVITSDGKSYRWSGSQYIEVDDSSKYYAVLIQNMTTMGELRHYIDGINEQGMHCFFDFSRYLENAFVCTVLMFTQSNINYCLIFDIVNGKTVINYNGYSDDETIQNYVNVNADNLIRAIKITEANTTLADISAIISKVNDLNHHILFDVSSLNVGSYLCSILIANNKVKIMDIVSQKNVELDYDGTMLLSVALAGLIDLANLNSFGFKRIPVPASTTLTTDEVESFKHGVVVDGDFMGMHNPVFFPFSILQYGNYEFLGCGMNSNVQEFYMMYINATTHVISKNHYMFGLMGNGLFKAYVYSIQPYGSNQSKQLPAYPTDLTKQYSLEQNATSGNLAWNEKINNLAPEYDATATYAVGDIVIHDGALYQCTTAIETAEAWDATHWAQVKVDDVYADKNYFGFKMIDPPASTTLTDDKIALFQQGVVINGNFLGCYRPVFFPLCFNTASNDYQGLMLTTEYRTPFNSRFCFKVYTVNTNKVISVGANAFAYDMYGTGHYLFGKAFPSFPSNNNKVYSFERASTNQMAWVEKKYGPSVSDNAITELTYEKISVLSLSADKTFTLKAAQTDCIPEYKALITNSGSSAITLTFTGVGTIHTNDPNISLVAGTNSTATIPANTKVEVNIFDGDAIVYNKNAISYATNAEVEALFE